MSDLAAQISLYPLGRDDLSPAIDEFVRILEAHDLRVNVGPISTLATGDETTLLAALTEATRAVCAAGKVVLVTTISNACAV